MSVSGQPRLNAVLAGGTAISGAAVTLAANNTWYQLVASTTTPIYIFSVVFINGGSSITVDIGTGAAASETVVAAVSSAGEASRADRVVFPYPIRIPANTRVAIRSTSAGGYSAAINYAVEAKVA